MGEYTPEVTEYLPTMTVLMRLTSGDTEFLLERIKDAASRGTGANLVFMNFRGAISQVRSQEHPGEVKFIAFAEHGSFRIESPQLGYDGKYSHVELTVNKKAGIEAIKRFLDQVAGQ